MQARPVAEQPPVRPAGGPSRRYTSEHIPTAAVGLRYTPHLSPLIDICHVSELPPGATRIVTWEDLEIGIVNCNGEIRAIEDRCSHDNGILFEGTVDAEKCVVECPRHGSLFDMRTGKPLNLPAYVPIETFPVHIEDDTVKVEVD
jgi:3-phenylpropionate/trans-cinnamate dioxygenase ferredoxin subunit